MKGKIPRALLRDARGAALKAAVSGGRAYFIAFDEVMFADTDSHARFLRKCKRWEKKRRRKQKRSFKEHSELIRRRPKPRKALIYRF